MRRMPSFDPEPAFEEGARHMNPTDLLGRFASSVVFANFCARRMVPLRMLAAASNLAFIGCGYCNRLWLIVALHAALLPVNLTRLSQALSCSNWISGRSAPHPVCEASAGAEPAEIAVLS
jgi:hypothetical protein